MAKPAKDTFSFRAIRRTDIPNILRLEERCFPDPWPRASFDEMLDDPLWHTLMAICKGKIIGYAAWLVAAEEAHLANIAVTPEWRRKSVAKSLLHSILNHAVQQGCGQILLEVRESNETARAFYERFGFKDLYQRPRYYRNPVESAMVMVRSLEKEQESRK